MRRAGLLLLVGGVLLADSFEAGAVFLCIFPGARQTAMAGAFVAMADDAYSLYYNPAGVAFATKKRIALQHSNWLPGLYPGMYYEYAGAVIPAVSGVWGVNAIYLTTGEFEVTGEDEEVTAKFVPFDFSIKVTYARKLTERTAVGVSCQYIYSYLAPEWLVLELLGVRGGKGMDVAIDFSMIHRINPRLSVGMALQNVGPTMRYVAGGVPVHLPTTLRLGMAWYPLKKEYLHLLLTMDLIKIVVNPDFANLKYEWEDTWKAVGLEFSYGEFLSLRGGFFMDQTGERVGPTYGFGIGYKNFRFDIGVDSQIYDFTTSNYRFSAEYSF